MADTLIQRAVGDIEFDVTVEERHEDSLTITEHPVEKGAAISDHAYKNPMRVTISAGKGAKDGETVPQETYDALLELQKSREPFNIVTGKRSYENMLVEDIQVITDVDTDNVLMVTLDCREVIIVATETVQVPPSRQRQADKTQKTQQAGTKQAQSNNADGSGNSGDAKKSSTLNNILGGR